MKKLRDIWQAATLFEKLTLILSPLYVLTPIDFIPEAVFGIFGLFDDATAVSIFVWTIRTIHKRLENDPKYQSHDAKKNQVPNNLIP
ncbi:MAG: YkvA family protein [Chloroherpetonaceae bacterium]